MCLKIKVIRKPHKTAAPTTPQDPATCKSTACNTRKRKAPDRFKSEPPSPAATLKSPAASVHTATISRPPCAELGIAHTPRAPPTLRFSPLASASAGRVLPAAAILSPAPEPLKAPSNHAVTRKDAAGSVDVTSMQCCDPQARNLQP
ncbi:hypothetical protein BC826DRAFT_1109625 [Russula brevipes]|nr:hypothetical protein BC826DRAFT_1109625 [Russula brevipes]